MTATNLFLVMIEIVYFVCYDDKMVQSDYAFASRHIPAAGSSSLHQEYDKIGGGFDDYI